MNRIGIHVTMIIVAFLLGAFVGVTVKSDDESSKDGIEHVELVLCKYQYQVLREQVMDCECLGKLLK